LHLLTHLHTFDIMYVYKIIPKLKSSGQDSFDYLSDSPLDTGQIVEINFGKNKTFGVVLKAVKKSNYASKKIIRKISLGSVFTQKQFQLAQKLSSHYLCSLGETIFSFLPTMNVGDLKKLTGATNSYAREGSKTKIYVAGTENRENYFIQNSLFGQGQALVVLPEISQIKNLSANLKKIAPQKKIFEFHSFLKSAQKAKIWNHLSGRKDAIIIGTRQSLFLPFTSLSLICIDEPLDFAYDEDQVPYYQAFFVARRLAQITGASLIIGESVPSVSSYVAYRQNKVEIIQKNEKKTIIILDQFRNFSKQLSLQRMILQIINSNSKICFIGPWKNQVKIICADCKNEIICKKCQSAYFDQTNGACIGCSHLSLACPSCQGTNLKKYGLSYKEIRESIEKALPQTKNAIYQTQDIDRNKNIFILSPSEAQKSKIQFDAIVFPYFDLMKNFASLGYRHKIFRLIYNLSVSKGAKIVLMGENLNDDRFTNYVKKFDFYKFLSEETIDRRKFSMPPFGKAVEVIAKSKSGISPRKKIEKLSQAIQKEIMILDEKNTEKTKTVKGLFFIPLSSWENKKEDIKKFLKDNIHLRIDRSDYL